MSPLFPSHARVWCAALLVATLLVVTLLAAGARATTVHHFEPAGGARSYVVTPAPEVPGHLVPAAWLLGSYARDPLVLRDPRGALLRKVVEHQGSLELGASVGLFDLLELGIAAPAGFFAGDGLDGHGLALLSLADPRLMAKLKLTPWQEGFLAALHVDADVPLSRLLPDHTAAADARAPRLRAGLAIGHRGQGWRAGLDVGYVLRAPTKLGQEILGHEVTWGLGGEVGVWPGWLSATGDVYGRVAHRALFSSMTQTPVEGALGLKATLGPIVLTGGVGAGLWPGYGTPSARLFVGLAFVPPSPAPVAAPAETPPPTLALAPAPTAPPAPRDTDGDGRLDDVDRCPVEAEDEDGFDDEDGCPDFDDDADGLPDGADRCPREAEDRDGWQDDDGCPEPDNDGDGTPDLSDECPNDPETANGHEDEDGCPDSLDPREETVVVKRASIEFGETVFFRLESDKLLPRARRVLRRVARVINAHAEIEAILIEGHTDATGPDRYNQRLSTWRALAVRRFLIRAGVEPERLKVRALGDSRPASSNRTRKGRAKNRRVELHILTSADVAQLEEAP